MQITRKQNGRQITFRLEAPNGEMASLQSYLAGLVKTQDLLAWVGHESEMKTWIASRVADYIRNLDVVLQAA